MKLSVALTTYNGAKYIEEQLRSILDQTRQVDEVVIVDDVSGDDTVSVIKKFISDHDLKNWICVVNETNLGFRENFRKAIDLTTGDIVFLCDQDDIWIKDRVEVMSAIMEKQSEIGVLSTNYRMFDDPNEIYGAITSETTVHAKIIPFNKHTLYLRSLGCAMCFKKEFYNYVKQFWTHNWAHDTFLWSISLLLSKGYSTEYCSLYHRVHDEQFSGHKNHEKDKRIALLNRTIQNQSDLLCAAKQLHAPLETQKILQKSLLTAKSRVELINERRILNAMPLLCHISYYYSKRSYFVELIMALRGES